MMTSMGMHWSLRTSPGLLHGPDDRQADRTVTGCCPQAPIKPRSADRQALPEEPTGQRDDTGSIVGWVRLSRQHRHSHNGAVTRTKFGRVKIGSLSSGSGRGGGSPRPERFVSEDAERAAGCEMALDVERVLDGGVNR